MKEFIILNKKAILIGLFLFLLFIVLVVVVSRAPGTVVIEVSPTSEIKNDIKAYLSNDKFMKEHKVPSKLELPRGKYAIYAVSKNSTVFNQKFTVKAGLTTRIQVVIKANPNDELTDRNTTDLKGPEFLNLLPYQTDYYHINADTMIVRNEIVVRSILITLYTVQARDQSLSDYYKMKESYIAEAKNWINQQGIPSTIPIIITNY